MVEADLSHRWEFRIGDAFPADSPLARFIVAVAQGMNDTHLANRHFVEAERPYELTYFFNLASSHLYEVAETFRKAYREWDEVRDFVASLEEERREEFARIAALADPEPPWPGARLKELRNSFFHYLRLDRAAADAGHLPLLRGLREASDLEGQVVIERTDRPLHGIRALFADEVFLKTVTADYDEGELDRLADAFANYQGELNRFAQAAVGLYVSELPDGVVQFEGSDEPPER